MRLSLWILLLLPSVAPAQSLGRERFEPAITEKENKLLAELEKQADADRAAAIRRLRGAIKPDSSAALDFALGVLQFRERNLEEAEAALDRAATKFPTFARAWDLLGRVRLLLERPGPAADALAKSIEFGRSSADTWRLLGVCHLQRERYAAAISAYRRALALTTDDAEIRAGLVSALLASEQFRAAIPLLRELCVEDARKSVNWMQLANAYLGIGSERKARDTLEMARRLGVLSRDGTLALGDLCYAEGLLALAVERYAEHGENELSRKRRLNCAEAYLALDRVDEAVVTLDAIEADEEPRYHLLRARVARQRADSNAARASWQRALELDPLAGEAMMGLGVLHLETGSLDRAGFYFERASRTPSHRLGALVQLAQLAVERQEYEDAVKRLEEAIDRGAGRLVERYLARIRRLAALGD